MGISLKIIDEKSNHALILQHLFAFCAYINRCVMYARCNKTKYALTEDNQGVNYDVRGCFIV